MSFSLLSQGLPDGVPKRTLGWGVLKWCSEFLVNPDSRGGVKGERWIFKPDQARFILWFYAVDEDGEWIYRRAYRERAKGTGKSPMVAAIACAEFLGPVKFSHFDETGQAVGVENEDSVVWLAAISQDGCQHTYRYIMGLLAGPAESYYGLDIGMTRVIIQGNASRRIETLTASFRSHEGPQPTFAICEETQNWVPAERGPDFFSTINRGLTKTDGRSIEVTNAPVPGEGSVAEETHLFYEDIIAGEAQDDGLLFDSVLIQVDDIYDEAQAIPALEFMYKEAPWMKVRRVWRDINDPQMREVDARRFFFNEMCSRLSMWIKKEHWENAQGVRPLKRTDKIALGFRGKKASTALVATRLNDGAMFLLELWEAKLGEKDYEVNYLEVDIRVRKYLAKYNVVSLFADHRGYQDIVARWFVDHDEDSNNPVDIKEFLTSNKAKMAMAIEQFETAVYDKRMGHDGNQDLSRHVFNCFTDEIPQGKVIRQETANSQRYIIAAEAAVIAYEAAQAAIEAGALREDPVHYVYSF